MPLLILLVAGFIVLSGLLAMVDAAVLSVSRAEVEEMVMKNLWGAKALRNLKTHITRAVVIIVIITNSINVLGPIIVGYQAVELYGSAIIGIITAVLTFGTIVFSEIIPKSLGSHYAPNISRFVAPFIHGLIIVLYPFAWSLEYLASLFRTGARKVGTEAQIRSLVSLGSQAGYINQDEGQMIHRAFVLNDRTAEDIMTPLDAVVGVPQSSTVREAAQMVFEFAYSRYPVYSGKKRMVHGYVLSQEILHAIVKGRDRANITSIMRAPLYIEADIPADRLLELFRDQQIHLGVVQKKGKFLGVVTLEDVLEELVGDINDEKDGGVLKKQSQKKQDNE